MPRTFVRNKSTKSSNNGTASTKNKKNKTKVKVEPEFIEDFPKGTRLEARCMKDQEAVIISDGQLVKTSNGRLMVRGVHNACKTNVSVFISQDKYDAAVKVASKKGKKK